MKTRYFVDPDSVTNRLIVDMLGQRGPEAEHHDLVCADGEPRNLWELSRAQVDKLVSEVSRLKLRFVVYRKIREGKVQKWKVCEPPPQPEVSVTLPSIAQTCATHGRDSEPPPF